jgi:hypothetical protein
MGGGREKEKGEWRRMLVVMRAATIWKAMVSYTDVGTKWE